MREGFSARLEALIDAKAEDFQVAKLFKEEKKHHYSELRPVFMRTSPKGFLVHHTRALEGLIIGFFRFVLRDSFGDYMPPVSTLPIAFVALGSFGREQAAPHSDVDLMIVYKEVKGYHLRPLIERVLYLAWDAGFHLGHRVHEVGELEEAAASDITIKTAIIEGRFFFGSRFLWVEIENALNRIRLSDRDRFVEAKLAEYAKRHREKPISMEPDLKEGVGGLRDSNTLFWIARTFFGVSSNKDLAGGLISEEAYRDYRQALDFIYRLRSGLHLIAGKPLDRLLFDYQREAALLLGFKDTKTRKAERYLLKRTLQALLEIERFSAFYTAKILHPQSDHRWLLSAREGVLSVPYECAPPPLKSALSQVLSRPERHYDISLVMALRRAAVPVRSGQGLKKVVRALFEQSQSHALIRLLYRAGRLDSLIAPMKPIIHLAQFDGYHQHPVDEHAINTLTFLENLPDAPLRDRFERLNEEDRLLLRIVALLHDCGKGGRLDHSEVGARRFRRFAGSIGLGAEAIETGAHLIRIHTLMSHVARTQDIHSDRVVLAFASQLKTPRLLDLLYLLTVADLSAVDRGVYSPFMANLLGELYQRTRAVIQKPEQVSEANLRRRKERALSSHEHFNTLSKTLQRKLLSVDSNLFFLKHTPEEMIDLARRTVSAEPFGFQATSTPHLTLEVIAKAPLNLGWLLGRLAWLDLSAMDIFKLFDGAKLFRMVFKKPLEEPLADLKALVEKSFDMALKLPYPRPVIAPGEIETDCDHSPTYARLSLTTADQQGLMAFMIDTFDSFQIDIATAKIGTVKGRTHDLFLIEKNGPFCHNREKILEALTKR
jgi:[protein-PII] uridylyltransferase